jgi:hypothetical protein
MQWGMNIAAAGLRVSTNEEMRRDNEDGIRGGAKARDVSEKLLEEGLGSPPSKMK